MSKKMRVLLWAGLFLFLALSYGGWHLRTSIEGANKKVFAAIDYTEFWKTASNANISMDRTLDQLYAQGVRYVGVRETTLRDLASRGDLFIQDYGQFRSFSQSYDPGVWAQASKAISRQGISPEQISSSCLTLIVSKPETTAFLKERLADRYNSGQIVSFQIGSNDYFVLNATLTQVDKRKDAKQELDAVLGFDLNTLTALEKKGFSIILRPENNKGPNLKYLDEYENIITRYHIKHLLFSNEVPGAPDHEQLMQDLVKKHQLIIGVVEPSTQVLYVIQPGLDQLMYSTGYPINRVYSSTNDEFVTSVDERLYRWVRGVIDRGIRIVYISPFKDAKLDASENLSNTLDSIGKFNQTIVDKDNGFTLNQDMPRLPDAASPPWQLLMVAFSLLLAGTLYLGLLFKLKPPWIIGLLIVGASVLIAANLLLHMDLTKLYALSAAILYPSLSSLLFLLYLRDSQVGVAQKMLVGLFIIVGVNMIGAYTVICSLSDIRFVMNIKDFVGVKAAFLIPLLLFALNYFSCFSRKKNLALYIWESLQQKPSYLVLCLFVLAAAGGYYYLGRSGNNVVTVSSLEIRLREILEGYLLARPRFKEFMVGYPALFASVYLYHKYRQQVILFILGFGIIIGNISMVNSFCHVFTAANISIIRTVGGLVLGIVMGVATLLVIWILEYAMKNWMPNSGEENLRSKLLN
ncbi:MAG TPA: DUF5693 family protein [Syntrophomonadaceae bacterium]|nr:DUF5693 family protein [Syntrophomonadaceae bacterium]